jgi:Sec-independent protein translocase protein TatA
VLPALIGSFYEDLFILLVALLLFGKRFPEVATTLGRKLYQLRRGMDELRAEISRPIRDEIERPLRDAANEARSAVTDADAQIRALAEPDEPGRAPSGPPPAPPPPPSPSPPPPSPPTAAAER